MRSTCSANQATAQPQASCTAPRAGGCRDVPGRERKTSNAPTITETRNASARMAPVYAAAPEPGVRSGHPGATRARADRRPGLAYNDPSVAKQTYQLLARLADRGMERRTWRAPARAARRGSSRSSDCRARKPAMPRSCARSSSRRVRARCSRTQTSCRSSTPAASAARTSSRASSSTASCCARSSSTPRPRAAWQVPLRAVLTIVAGIATALHFAHERKSGDGEPGFVHGNLTPSNVIISRDGVVKLLDFGVPGAARWPIARPSSCAAMRSIRAAICSRSARWCGSS